MIKRADERVLDWFTRACHAIQRSTGINSYQIGRVTTAIYALGVLIQVANYWTRIYPASHKSDLFDVIIGAPLALQYIYFSTRLSQTEPGTTLPTWIYYMRSYYSLPIRIIGIVIGFMTILILASDVMENLFHAVTCDGRAMAFFLTAYIVHVNPLPPATVRAWQWATQEAQ